MFTVEDKIFYVLYHIVIAKYSYFIITTSVSNYSFIYSWIARIIFLWFLIPSESYMEYREYQGKNHAWYADHFVNKSINFL